jgi:hypothetical protein
MSETQLAMHRGAHEVVVRIRPMALLRTEALPDIVNAASAGVAGCRGRPLAAARGDYGDATIVRVARAARVLCDALVRLSVQRRMGWRPSGVLRRAGDG